MESRFRWSGHSFQKETKGKAAPKRGFSVLKSTPAGTRWDKSGELHPVMQEIAVDAFSHVECTRSTGHAGNFSFQTHVGENPKTTPQVSVRQVTRLPMSRKQQRMIAWSNDQNKQFGPGRCF